MPWFYVLCAVCALRQGVDRAKPVFRVDVENWGNAAIEIRRHTQSAKGDKPRTSWQSIVDGDDNPEWIHFTVARCDHNHLFEGNVIGKIEEAIMEAMRVGAGVALIKPDSGSAAELKASLRRIRHQQAESNRIWEEQNRRRLSSSG